MISNCWLLLIHSVVFLLLFLAHYYLKLHLIIFFSSKLIVMFDDIQNFAQPIMPNWVIFVLVFRYHCVRFKRSMSQLKCVHIFGVHIGNVCQKVRVNPFNMFLCYRTRTWTDWIDQKLTIQPLKSIRSNVIVLFRIKINLLF